MDKIRMADCSDDWTAFTDVDVFKYFDDMKI